MHIDLANGYFSPNIYVPDEVLLNGYIFYFSMIYITNTANESSVVHLYGRKNTVAPGDSVTLMTHPIFKMWELVSSAK